MLFSLFWYSTVQVITGNRINFPFQLTFVQLCLRKTQFRLNDPILLKHHLALETVHKKKKNRNLSNNLL